MIQPPEPNATRLPSRRVAAVVVVVLIGLISHGHFAGSGDAVHYMVISHSVAFDGDLDLADDYADPDSLFMKDPLDHGLHARPGRGGRLRPAHDVGWPVLAAPLFAGAHALAARGDALPEGWRRRAKLDRWIALRQLLSLVVIGVSAVLSVVLLRFLGSLGHGPRTAAAGSLLVVLTAPVLTMAYVYMTEVPTALLALVLLDRLRRAPPTAWWSAAVMGLAIGLLVLVHVRNVGLALGLAAVSFACLRGWETRAGLALGVAVAAAVRSAVTLTLWGTWITTPHAAFGAFDGVWPLLAETATRLLGLAFDQRHGLVPVAPAALLVPAGWLMLRRREPRLAAWFLWSGGAYLALVAFPLTNPHGWRGGFSPAARFLVPVAPLLGVCVVEAVRASRRLLVLSAPLLALQVLVAVGFWSRPMLSWAQDPGPAPWLEARSLGALARLLPAWDPANASAVPASLALAAIAAGLVLALPQRVR
jgi:hypothetical protein